MAQKIKLSTIAETLGISTATVSLALRDSPLVAVNTREKIKDQARALGYIYNRRAAASGHRDLASSVSLFMTS